MIYFIEGTNIGCMYESNEFFKRNSVQFIVDGHLKEAGINESRNET